MARKLYAGISVRINDGKVIFSSQRTFLVIIMLTSHATVKLSLTFQVPGYMGFVGGELDS